MRVSVAAILLISFTVPALGQNFVSQGLLSSSEEDRHTEFTSVLRENGSKCDEVFRTLFSGSIGDMDNWEARCRDRNSYSLSVVIHPDAPVMIANCRDLLAASAMMLKAAKSRMHPSACQIEWKSPARQRHVRIRPQDHIRVGQRNFRRSEAGSPPSS
jgi:hypothetical protein